jgi:alpha-N-acetylglucosaminidase
MDLRRPPFILIVNTVERSTCHAFMNTRLGILAAGFIRFVSGTSRPAGFSVFLLTAFTTAAQDNATAVEPVTAVRPATSSTQSAQALIMRLIPKHADQFVCEIIPADAGKDVFEIESQDGKIVLRGNSALSVAVALNWYLKYTCHCHVSLNGSQLNLPRQLPVVEKKVRITGWAPSRYFLNYCTFSYSMSWWDWAQWEKFIDWMALNGINQPLAVTGQEAIWQAVGRRFGMTDAEIDAFLAGPPYLPFSWMGCLDGHGGPLPKDWISRHVELEKKILARERALGMTPVLQGFTGHTPEALLKKFPGTKAQRIHWIEFNTHMLDPQDPFLQKLGTAFLEEQTKLFGSDHLYAADSFIEMTPPSGDLTYLANTARAIYSGMAQADPQAVWVLQGWIFINQAQFWRPDRVQAFFDAVPSGRLLVLDLNCEERPTWSKIQGFYGKPWVWSFLYNYGNRSILGSLGPLDRFNDLADVRRHPLGQNLRGVGLMMEGYGHSPLILDLMFEMPWRNQFELKSWVQEFARFRYGKENADAQAAWETLRTKCYNHGTDTGHNGATIVTAFPAVGRNYARYPASALAQTCRLMLHATDELGATETYRHDLVNVARQALSDHAGGLYQKAMSAYQSKDAAAFRQASAEFLQLIRDLDELLAASDQFLLGSWLEDAKRWGATDAERARLEWNARRILTLWGTGPAIRDYAWKEWSGLLTGFYAKRWEIFFRRQQAALDGGQPFDQEACQAELYRFENAWCQQHEPYPAKPTGDSLAVAQRLFDKYLSAPPVFQSLTTGKPATCSFALPGMDADFANDGAIDTESYWATDTRQDPAAWWQVDLEKPDVVGRVVVVGYHGDLRHYGFTVAGSLDGRSWDTLADRRDNTSPATSGGYECQFTPREIRYLRVTQTANSANTGRHLVEVMAFEK